MKKSRLLACATVVSLMAAAPALAEWQHVGTVEISSDGYTAAHVTGIPGPVDQLRLRADNKVECDRVRAVYDNGYSEELYSGTLYEGRAQTMYFPEGARHVSEISLDCRSRNGDPARVSVSADSRGYDSGPVVYRGVESHAGSDLIPLASREFGDEGERSVMLTGGSQIDSVAIQPVDADARCTRVTAMFDDGSTNDLVPNDGGRLRAGEVYRLDITSRDRDLNSIEMTCRATDSDSVKINVYGRI